LKILALIPARGGSKGIPRKNVKLLGDQPLINYTIASALACDGLSTVVVSTDDAEIAQVSQAAGAAVPFMRPAALAADKSPTLDTVIHAINYYQDQGQEFDAVCLLQPTCPFRTSAEISRAIDNFKAAGGDSLISVQEVPHHYNPHWVYEPQEGNGLLKIATGEAEIISRRQDLPKAYHRDGSIYLTKTEVLLEQRSLYGQSIAYVVLNSAHHVNIDTPDDWTEAERLLESFRKG
ncbi:MAG: acylneuraminate cytidylyltransferase family protein, partial [Bacteroidota bacterium]